jgi:hypothetical protein
MLVARLIALKKLVDAAREARRKNIWVPEKEGTPADFYP